MKADTFPSHLTAAAQGWYSETVKVVGISRRKDARYDYHHVTATLRKPDGEKLKISFTIFPEGKSGPWASVKSANIKVNGKLIKWAADDDHGRSEDLSQNFKSQMNAVVNNHQLVEKAQLPLYRRLLRRW